MNPNISWNPIIISSSDVEFNQNIDDLVKNQNYQLVDDYEHQVDELLKIRSLANSSIKENFKVHKINFIEKEPFCMVAFPWNKKVVKLLAEDYFFEVRTNRNKLKITEDEQQALKQKCVGVIGMSVGRAVATTLVLEGVAGTIKLADFDTLDLSNLNRLKAPVYDLGLPKVISVARELMSINPYLKLELFSEGITNSNLSDFITGENPIDLLIEECDSLPVKISSRLKAREFQVPVIMETSDRGMLDVERFDLEPNRPIFHGKIKELDWNETIKTKEGYQELLFSLVDYPNLSEKAKRSMQEIGKSISTWPQLGSAVVLGGGTVTHTARKILLGEKVDSGRYYIDIDELIS